MKIRETWRKLREKWKEMHRPQVFAFHGLIPEYAWRYICNSVPELMNDMVVAKDEHVLLIGEDYPYSTRLAAMCSFLGKRVANGYYYIIRDEWGKLHGCTVTSATFFTAFDKYCQREKDDRFRPW